MNPILSRLKTLLPCALLLCTCAAGYCRLGESEQQIITRYGKPFAETAPGKDLHGQIFRTPGYVVKVLFWNGASCLQLYSRADGSALSRSEIRTFLADNGDGKSWTGKTEADGNRDWLRSDYEAFGLYETDKSCLMVLTRRIFENRQIIRQAVNSLSRNPK